MWSSWNQALQAGCLVSACAVALMMMSLNETLPWSPSCLFRASRDRKSTRLNSSHSQISYAVFCLKKKNFRIASVSKPLTAADVVLLYEQGKLDLDAPLLRYVTTFTDYGYPISTRQLT